MIWKHVSGINLPKGLQKGLVLIRKWKGTSIKKTITNNDRDKTGITTDSKTIQNWCIAVYSKTTWIIMDHWISRRCKNKNNSMFASDFTGTVRNWWAPVAGWSLLGGWFNLVSAQQLWFFTLPTHKSLDLWIPLEPLIKPLSFWEHKWGRFGISLIHSACGKKKVEITEPSSHKYHQSVLNSTKQIDTHMLNHDFHPFPLGP